MLVIISGPRGEHYVEVEDSRSSFGYRVLDGDGLLSPSPGVACFLETIAVGQHPWVGYVDLNDDSDLGPTNHTRLPLRKSDVLRVVR